MGSFAALLSAALAGGLDGVAASGDTKAGRHWESTGIAETGPFVMKWGLAPVAQVAEIGLGTALAASQKGRVRDAGRGSLMAGTGCLARALFFQFAQHREGTGQAAQGFRVPPFSSYDNPMGLDRFGGRISGYLADGSNAPAGAPKSHYVSNYDASLVPG